MRCVKKRDGSSFPVGGLFVKAERSIAASIHAGGEVFCRTNGRLAADSSRGAPLPIPSGLVEPDRQ